MPRLQDRLTDQKLDALEADARRAAARRSADALAPALEGEELAGRVATPPSRSSAEVLVLTPLGGKPTGLTLAEDSTPTAASSPARSAALALKALETGKPQTTTVNAGVGQPGARRASR